MKKYLVEGPFVREINEILVNHNPSKWADLEDRITFKDETSELWGQPYDIAAEEIAKGLEKANSVGGVQTLVHEIFVEHTEFTYDGLEEDSPKHHTFPGKAGKPEDYRQISEEIYALKEKSTSQ